MTAEKLQQRRGLLRYLDQSRRDLERTAAASTWQRHRERAYALLTSSRTAAAFEVGREPAKVRERYGKTVNGMGLLLARRLVEAGVPFVTVFWMPDKRAAEENKCSSAGGWDTHGNNFHCLQRLLLPEFDRCFSALIEDLHSRGLLKTTLALVTSEMGRRPKIGDPRTGGASGAGRDHWTYCLTDLLAGGGIRGGRTYGSSDRHAEHPSDKRVTPADIVKTVYHAMGIHDLSAIEQQNRPYSLLEDGRALCELFEFRSPQTRSAPPYHAGPPRKNSPLGKSDEKSLSPRRVGVCPVRRRGAGSGRRVYHHVVEGGGPGGL
jgi:hypothetical protein